MTAKRIIAGEVLKYRNGLRISGHYETRFAGSSYFALTLPTQTPFAKLAVRGECGLIPGSRRLITAFLLFHFLRAEFLNVTLLELMNDLANSSPYLSIVDVLPGLQYRDIFCIFRGGGLV